MKIGKYRISFKNNDLIVLLIMFVWATAYYIETARMKQAELMLALIQPVFIIMLVLGLIYVVKNVKIESAAETAAAEKAPAVPVAERVAGFMKKNNRYIGFTVIMFAYLFVMNWIGFVTGTILYLFATMYFLGLRKVHLLVLIPLVASFAIYFIFGKLFYVKLPEGILL